jgi:hypothetical protein
VRRVIDFLRNEYGGKWDYVPQTGSWVCEDGRYVCKVHSGGFDESGEALPGFTYRLYQPDGTSDVIHQLFPVLPLFLGFHAKRKLGKQ